MIHREAFLRCRCSMAWIAASTMLTLGCSDSPDAPPGPPAKPKPDSSSDPTPGSQDATPAPTETPSSDDSTNGTTLTPAPAVAQTSFGSCWNPSAEFRVEADRTAGMPVAIQVSAEKNTSPAPWQNFQRRFSVSASGGPVSVRIKYDSAKVSHPAVVSRLQCIPSLSVARANTLAVRAGRFALFAGGTEHTTLPSPPMTVVDLLDVETGVWSNTALSVGRSDMAAAANERYAAFVGGRTEDLEYSNLVEAFDAVTGTWRKRSLSEAKSRVAAGFLGDRLLTLGGFLGGGWTQRVEIFNFSPEGWLPKMDGLIGAREGLVAWQGGNKLYAAGGYNSRDPEPPGSRKQGDYFRDVDVFAGERLWPPQTRRFLSTARADFAVAVAGNFMVIAGGRNAWGLVASAEVLRVDSTDGPTNGGSLRFPRDALSAAACPDRILFAGGRTGSEPGSFTAAVDIFDIRRKSILSPEESGNLTLKSARGHLSSVGVGNRLLFAGGMTSTAASRDIDIFNCDTGKWEEYLDIRL